MGVSKCVLVSCLRRARSGWVSDFDWMRQRHTVRYDDDDVEVFPLWGPSQQARTINRGTFPKWQNAQTLKTFLICLQCGCVDMV